jgi:hypothetical protein
MAEHCPLKSEHGGYLGPEIPERCLGCLAVSEENGTLNPVSTELINSAHERLQGINPSEMEAFSMETISRPDDNSNLRVYSVEHYIEAQGRDPQATHVEVFELNCRYK